MFQFETSGNEKKDEYLESIELNILTLLVFHLEISGNKDKDEHP